jgi:hypothetical protein
MAEVGAGLGGGFLKIRRAMSLTSITRGTESVAFCALAGKYRNVSKQYEPAKKYVGNFKCITTLS